MLRTLSIVLAASCLVGPSPVDAQPMREMHSAAVTYYSRAKNAYDDGEYQRAATYFDRAIGYASNEPRLYYFRGLAKYKAGQKIEGENDLRTAAVMESNRQGRFNLGPGIKSLPGEDRRIVERIREEVLGSRAHAERDRRMAVTRFRFRLPIEAIQQAESPDDLTLLLEPSPEAKTALAALDADPFADDPLPPDADAAPTVAGGDSNPGETASAGGAPPVEVEVPAAAEGSMKVGELFGTLFGAVAERASDLAPGGEALSGLPIPQLGPPGPPPGGDFGGDGFGGDDFGAGDETPFGGPPPGGGGPFGGGPTPADDSPFGPGPPPANGNPFGAGPLPAEGTPFGDGAPASEPPVADDASPPTDDNPFGGDDPFGGADMGDPF